MPMAGWSRYAVMIALLLAGFVSCGYFVSTFDACETRISEDSISPDGKHRLVVFHRDCGATVDFNTQASVVPAGASFSFDGNPPFVSVSGDKGLDVHWTESGAISVTFPRAEKIHRKDDVASGIPVQYRQ